VACITILVLVVLHWFKTQRGGQNAILVYIAHILQTKHPPLAHRFRRVWNGKLAGNGLWQRYTCQMPAFAEQGLAF